ncbi:MAG: glycosyltransferase family 2 protein [Xanthomonadales bacterium]|nr:glycosyltransferase family 2 protein [Xanthomonadales bacterium]
MQLAIVIPSYQRGSTLLESALHLLALSPPADELLIVDQSPQHSETVEQSLRALHESGRIHWLRLERPSIPHAMNVGLLEAKSDRVLFLDDDIVPDAALVAMHRLADASLVAGMVLQPGQRAESLKAGEAFRFNSDTPAEIREFMGGNFSIRRDSALALGGFDENFVGAAYRFEAEFAHRYVQAHGPIRYEPRAIIHHLQIPTGGTRAHGHHLRTLQPTHSVGAYYELLRTRRPGWWRQILWRPIRAVRTRHHLRRPWWIPLTLLAELRGLVWAVSLNRKGPRLLGANT